MALTPGYIPPVPTETPPTGVLLIQLGTPDSPRVGDVRTYLREFLSDPRVLDIAAPLRRLLLEAVILPFRPRRSAEAYEKIWTDEGSPLLIHTAALAEKVAVRLGPAYRVEVGMRYRKPAIADAMQRLLAEGCDRLVIFPLFPQYASASTGSALARAMEDAASKWNVPEVVTVGDFYDEPGFIAAATAIARPLLDDFAPDHVLFSYHGLPEKQIHKSDPTGAWCLQTESCCDRITEVNRWCYRAQSFATTRALASELGLDRDRHSTAFQSRLAGQKWIEPYTDKVLPELHDRGVRRLAVITPSFTADCLETIEEIGIRGREQWESLGGDAFLLVPCVNADETWADAVADMVREAA